MHNSEIIPALIARIRQNNTDNVVIRSKLYNLLNDVTNKFDDVIKVTRSCSNCEKYGSMRCPNSFYCYSTENKPFFKPKHNGK